MKNKNINIKFESSDLEILEELAREKRVSVSAYVRMIITSNPEFLKLQEEYQKLEMEQLTQKLEFESLTNMLKVENGKQ